MRRVLFKRFLGEHESRVFGYAFYFLHNREDAEDVTQEVFLRLWRYWDRVDRDRMAAWVMRVTHNCCIDWIRSKKTSVLQQRSRVDVDALVSNADGDSDPESQYVLTEEQKVLLDAMETLPEKTKSMLLLHYFQGLKYEEIGEILDTKVSTVKVAVHRGRKVLRDVLREQFPENMGKGYHEYAVS